MTRNEYIELNKNKANRMGPGGSCRPRSAHDASATSTSTSSTPIKQELEASGHDFEILTYKTTFWRTMMFYILSFGTCGIFWLYMFWRPRMWARFRGKLCFVESSDFVLITDSHGKVEVCTVFYRNKKGTDDTVVVNTNGTITEIDEIFWFVYRKIQYTWIDGEWATAARAYSNITPESVIKAAPPEGLSSDSAALRRTFFDLNTMKAELTPFIEVVLKEVASPFYIFQVFSVIVWYLDEYYYYSTLIVIMTSYSIFLTLKQTRDQEKRIRSMVVENDSVQAIRDGRLKTLDSSELVPGDVLVIPTQGSTMYCDAVLLNGSVVVNESMLTGESMPITKTAIVDDGHEKLFSFERHSKNILFNGTTVLQTKYYKGQNVKALVLRTAYSTTKGQLVRSIMYPKPADFRFLTELMKFVGVLSFVALFGFTYTGIILYYRGSSLSKILVRACDLVTIVVPPALPAVMSIGIFYAQKRLKEQSIFCISPTTINTCGAIDVVCFDKTGTLTEDGLDFYAIRLVEKTAESVSFSGEIKDIMHKHGCHNIVQAMATCHSLSKINHELHGDPLDAILFEQTKFSLEEDDSESHDSIESIQPILVRPPKSSTELLDCSILKQFTFNSSLQRMSVIVATDDKIKCYSKGSPEMILTLCEENSIPHDFHNIVEEYTQHGFRLIAVAEKDLSVVQSDVQKLPRNLVERDLNLIGLIALENRLKPVTTDVIKKLNTANIRTVMVTGDNLLTALSVARDCGIISAKRKTFLLEHEYGLVDSRNKTILTTRERNDISAGKKTVDLKTNDLTKMNNPENQFVISGSTFAVISREYPQLVSQLVCVCNVFARMTPDQKQLLVENLQQQKCTVAMCGDGANDCAALKAAHAGISLSDAEASIAAPFTSKVADIRCVLTMISEGRAALVTSFSAFLCMAGYSLTQFISILLLYWISSSYSQMQFLFIDMPIVTLLAWLSSRTRAHTSLAVRPPPTSILSSESMVSLFGQLSIGGFSQIMVFCLVTLQTWFVPHVSNEVNAEEDRMSMQGTSIFFVSIFHYIVLYCLFAKGPPYRGSIYSNKPFFGAIIIVTFICVSIVLTDIPWVLSFLGCVHLPLIFRVTIFVIAGVTGLVSMIFDCFVEEISEFIDKQMKHWSKEKNSTCG